MGGENYEELDKFKTREGILGENSRYFNRLLDDLREKGSLYDGVLLEELNSVVRIESNNSWDGLENLDVKSNDNLIIATTNFLTKHNKNYEKVILITKDINLRVKCDAIKLRANDYYADYEFIMNKNVFTGVNQIEAESSLVSNLYSNKYLRLEKLTDTKELFENECVVVKSIESVSSYATVNSSFTVCASPLASTISISKISQFELVCRFFTTCSNLIKPRSLFSAFASVVARVTLFPPVRLVE